MKIHRKNLFKLNNKFVDTFRPPLPPPFPSPLLRTAPTIFAIRRKKQTVRAREREGSTKIKDMEFIIERQIVIIVIVIIVIMISWMNGRNVKFAECLSVCRCNSVCVYV